MISSLRGVLAEKSPAEVLIDVGGVGYAVLIPLSTFDHLGEVGSAVTLFTHHYVREDGEQLYGFISRAERDLFRMLLSVNGIGPKIALGILSRLGVEEIIASITSGDVGVLQRTPGIGKKIAERMIIELRDRIGRERILEEAIQDVDSTTVSEALNALIALGMTRTQAENALRNAIKSLPKNTQPSVEVLVKTALTR
ncbi:MAG: Holliday junction branch migration protein RuvA [Bacteroidota bacterium]